MTLKQATETFQQSCSDYSFYLIHCQPFFRLSHSQVMKFCFAITFSQHSALPFPFCKSVQNP